MDNNRKYINYTWFVLWMVFLVILAGGVVRMTQSGMGCPDWPKCFGRWIPPTSVSELPDDYEKYLKKQDIDHTFNAYHTWIEYINRLMGALLGLFIFIHFIWTYRKFRKRNTGIIMLSLLLLIAVGFQGWLGKKVVDHNLAVVKITTHMLVALVIAAIPLMIIYRLKERVQTKGNLLKIASVLVLLLLLVQVIFGTQVREALDEISRPLKYQQRELWIENLGQEFVTHRAFSWVVLAATLFLCWKTLSYPVLRRHSFLVLSLVILTIMAGITMAWYDVPALAQPVHLLMASGLTLAVFALRLRLK